MEQFADYVRAGWLLTPIPTGHKSPVTPGWQKRENAIAEPELAAEFPGVGLLHAWSGTCVLDIDDFEAADVWCAVRGVDLNALWNSPDAVKISSGRPNRGKLLYALSNPLISKKVIEKIDKVMPDGTTKSVDNSVIDFRCGTRRGLTVQDVLPGSIHPGTGKPYVWQFDELVTHWSTPPQLPADVHALWLELLEGMGAAGESDTPPPAPTGADADVIRQVLALKDPDCDRDSWVKVLSMLHHETQGSDMGLALADEWSRKGKKYDGFEDVRTRWGSFSLNHPAPATMRGDIEGRPATADEFGPPPAPEVQAAEAEQVLQNLEVQAQATRKAAAEYLEKRMVYVVQLDRYYDTEQSEMLASDHALKHLLTSHMPYIKTVAGRTRIDPVAVLKNSGKKQVVKAPAFNPGEGLIFTYKGDRYINEYLPDNIKPVEPTARQREMLDWLFGRISDETYRKWLLQFYGHAIQKPGVKILSAPLIWSETTGNGKTALLADVPRLLFGERYSHSVTTQELEHTHNDYVIGKWFLTMSEMYMGGRADRHKLVNKLKMYITDALAVHPKGKPAYTTRNNLVNTASSNYEEAAAIDDNDRRWGVHHLRAKRMTEGESAALFDDFLRRPGAEGPIRGYFMGVDLAGFVPTNAAPITADRAAMVDANVSDAIAAIREAVMDETGPFRLDLVSGNELQDYLQTQNIRNVPSSQWLGREVQKAPLKFGYRQYTATGGMQKARLFAVRNQAYWATATGNDALAHWRSEGDLLTS